MHLNTVTDFAASRRGKWVVLAIWLALTLAVVLLAPRLEDVTENDDTSFLPDGAEATRAAELAEERFPNDGTPAIIVFRNPDGLTDADYAAAQQLSDWLAGGAAGANVDGVAETRDA